ncbi:TPA: TrbG/VirB9 family P-type conjugative transfer protein [Neisseria subflava]
MLKKIVLLATVTLLFQEGVYAAAIQEYTFQENTTYPVYTAQGVVTQIELDPREKVKDFGAGLSDGWDLVRRENVFYLRPKSDAADTNLIVRTQTHQYIFELKVMKNVVGNLLDASTKGVNYQVKFRYPDSTDFSLRATTLAGYSLKYDSSKNYNTNYDVAAHDKSRWLVPLKVYDDGMFTYVYLNKGKFTGDFPTVYGRKSEKGAEFVLNSNVEGNVIIVHGTYPFLVLRHGNDVVGLRRN